MKYWVFFLRVLDRVIWIKMKFLVFRNFCYVGYELGYVFEIVIYIPTFKSSISFSFLLVENVMTHSCLNLLCNIAFWQQADIFCSISRFSSP